MNFLSTTIQFFIRSRAGVFFLLTLITASLYAPTLSFDFVSYDDDFHVYGNQSVQDFSPAAAWDILTDKPRLAPGFKTGEPVNRLYIPLTLLSFQLQHKLTGLNPKAFHAGNVLLFALLVLAVYESLNRWLKDQNIALALALLFAVHPLNAEPVAWISGRKDLLCALFLLIGIWNYANYTAQNKKIYFFSALSAGLFAALSKPLGAVFPILLLAYDFCSRPRVSFQKILSEKIPFALLCILPLLWTLPDYGLPDNRPLSASRMLFSLGVPFFNLGHVWLPWNLSAFYPYPNPLTWSLSETILILTGAFSILGLWRFAHQESRLRSFAGIFLIITFIPAWYRTVLYTDGGFTSDRYMLLPMMGILLLGGIGLKNFCRRLPPSSQKRFVMLLTAIAVLWLAGLSTHRIAIWKDTETLALSILAKYPSAANAHAELGRIYKGRGLTAKAAAHLKSAYLADPKPYRLIQLYELWGLNQPLITLYQRALTEDPEDLRLIEGLALVYFRIKQYTLAEEYLRRALKQDSNNTALENLLAGTLYYQGKKQDAVALWERRLSSNPTDTEAANNLGIAYLSLGKTAEARQLFERVLTLNPQHQAARQNLAKLQATA